MDGWYHTRGAYGMRGDNLKIRQSLIDVIRKRSTPFSVTDMQNRVSKVLGMTSENAKNRVYFVLYGLQREGRIKNVSRGMWTKSNPTTVNA